jgi:hypothetical protein
LPVHPLPENSSLENLRKQAKDLLRDVRAGDAKALARVREFHPRPEAAPGLADAQLVVARGYGFPSWPKLKHHLEGVARFAWDPLAETAKTTNDADAFVRLACLEYGRWSPADADEAAHRRAARPELSTSSIAAAAASGDVAALGEYLDRDSRAANAKTGPYGWPPLLYACYSRVPSPDGARSTLAAARLLLERGADPNAGFLWGGNLPPFTALTGAYGEGEGGASQPAHPECDRLARLLLEAGADPNDGQVLYNRHFRKDDGHLRLLFEFGLGGEARGPWHARFPEKLQSPKRLLVEELWAAARRGFMDRVRLLVEHGADVATPGLRDGRTPYEAAVLTGHDAIAAYLVAHGAKPAELDPLSAFEAACVAGRAADARAALARHPDLFDRLGLHGRLRLLQRAVEGGQLEGIRLMAELGFELSGSTRHDNAGINLATTPLHNAAWIGNLEMVRLLVALGSDPTARDPRFDATPAGWAAYNQHADVAAYLEKVEAERVAEKRN